MEKNIVIHGNNKKTLRAYGDNSFDSIVTDSPYGINFMGQKWDYQIPSVEQFQECLRVLKPGGHMLCFAGTRTQHRMAVNIEDAGFEIRDMIAWVYGSGFPKSQNIGRAVDRIEGNERENLGVNPNARDGGGNVQIVQKRKDDILTKGQSKWEGYGSALKPAMEMITMARKPIEKGLSIAKNCLKWGTGGLNIDGCRIGTEENLKGGRYSKLPDLPDGNAYGSGINKRSKEPFTQPQGRFPANFIHSGEEEVLRLFPNTKSGKSNNNAKKGESGNITPMRRGELISRNDDGSAARFFYCAKASKKERGEYNNHTTVKPIALMRYLVRLVTPGGVVLDPFCGSGSTLIAAMLEGFDYVGIDSDENSVKISRRRLEDWSKNSINKSSQQTLF